MTYHFVDFWAAGAYHTLADLRAIAETLIVTIDQESHARNNPAYVVINADSDWLDPDVPVEWLGDLLRTIHRYPRIQFLLITENPELWRFRMSHLAESPCEGWSFAAEWLRGQNRSHRNLLLGVRFGSSRFVNLARWAGLADIPCRMRFVTSARRLRFARHHAPQDPHSPPVCFENLPGVLPHRALDDA